VIGSGRIGPGLALFFSRALTPHGVPVFVTDLSPRALDEGREYTARRLLKAVDLRQVQSDQAQAVANNIRFSPDKSFLVECDLVIEAVPERLETKISVFDDLERLVNPQAILASNSSHLEPEILFAKARHPERTIVLHHFFPAETNPLVEVVAGPKTRVTEGCLRFYETLGKVPIRAGARYGYALNPIFEGFFLAALLEAEKGLPTPVIDAIASRAFGMAAGPFTTANLSRSAALRQTGLRELGRKIMPWFRSPALLDEKAATGERWDTAGSGDTVSYSDAMYGRLAQQLMGAYFGLACEVLESGQASLGDIETGVEIGLSMKPPFTMMNEAGPRRTRELVEAYAKNNPGFKVPRQFGPWTIPHVYREDHGDVAVVTLKRPRTLNALTPEAFRQLDLEFAAIQKDPKIRAAVVTGFGTRSFVSGTDIRMLAAIRTPEEACRLAKEAHGILSRIASLGKPVVCALNGPALGSGCELAYACSTRIAPRGTPSLFSHPEVRLGLIPGAGGTQRLIRLIDVASAWKLLRTGGSIGSAEAHRLGLLLEEVDGDLIERAKALARKIQPAPLPSTRAHAALPEVDLSGLSRKIDEILRKAILKGATMPFEKALEFEAECFGEVFATKDCRIGLENFLRTRLREPARFVHA
jgi:enoyl-CoA hydratase/carnithine racemase/3-hydroxyacyl-CoA dehydrogenase